jgi:hypothetical protein
MSFFNNNLPPARITYGLLTYIYAFLIYTYIYLHIYLFLNICETMNIFSTLYNTVTGTAQKKLEGALSFSIGAAVYFLSIYPVQRAVSLTK